MLDEPLYPLHARYFAAGDSLHSSIPNSRKNLVAQKRTNVAIPHNMQKTTI